MQVLRQILPPRMQNRGDPDGATKMARIASEGQQRGGRRPEEKRVEHPWIALRQCVEIVWEREDDVEVGNGQQVRLARREPPFCGERLALGAMTIATGVVRDPHRAAVVTRLPTPAEDGGTAGCDRPQRYVLDRREVVCLTRRVAMRLHDVREFQPPRGARACRASLARTHGSVRP